MGADPEGDCRAAKIDHQQRPRSHRAGRAGTGRVLRPASERTAVPLLVGLQVGLGPLTAYGVFALARILFGTRPALAIAILLCYYVAGHALANARLRYVVPVMSLFIVPADTLGAVGPVVLGGRRPMPMSEG